MWKPANPAEVEDAARDGWLRETTTFDAKAALPPSGKNVDLAVDVCAMTVDGGVLLYGVAEDEQENLTIPQPLELAGQRERIDQVVQTSISEPPFIEVESIPLSDDPGRGYLAILVPQSPRAPHQVTVKGELRFYGRGATGNRVLTEGEIARLYRRREQWDVDAQHLLEEVVRLVPRPPEPYRGFMHAFARPVPPDEGMWDRALGTRDRGEFLTMLAAAGGRPRPSQPYDPDLRSLTNWRPRGADVWTVQHDRDLAPELRCDLNMDGRGQLFCARAADRPPAPGSDLLIFEVLIGGNLASFLAIMGAFYEAAGYHGPVDVGLAVTGIEGSRSGFATNPLFERRYGAPEYRRTARPSAGELLHPETVVEGMLRRLVDATLGRSVDLFVA